MKLLNAAKYFDRDSVYDADTGAFLFKAQFSSYDQSSPDGSFQRRRVMSAAPPIVLPERRYLKVHGEEWLSGDFARDGFFDAPIRKTAPCMLVTDRFSLLTPAQAALGASAGLPMIPAQTRYMRDQAEGASKTSDSDPTYQIYIARTETVPDGYFLKTPKTMYHIRSVHDLPEGFIVAECDQVERMVGPQWTEQELWDSEAEVTVEFEGAIDPVTELPTASITTTGLLLDLSKLFRLGTAASPKADNGDRALLVSKVALTPVSGTVVQVETLRWRIVTVQGYHDAWLLHLRRE